MRDVIWKATYDLLAEAPIDSIRTSEIVTKAAVGRTTFYRMFFDKYDVVNWGFGTVYDRWLAIDSRCSTLDESVLRNLLLDLQSRRTIVLHAFSSNDPNGLKSFTISYLSNFVRRSWQAGDRRVAVTISPRETLLAEMYAIGVTDYMVDWIKGSSVPAAKVAEAMVAALPGSL